jgi:hypothetical protein
MTLERVSRACIPAIADIVCVAGASGYSANPFRVKWQLETRENPEQRNEYCRSIITRKIEATIITLEKSIPRSDKWERAMKSAYAALSQRPTPPHFRFNASHLPRGGDEHVASCSRGCLKFQELPLIVLFTSAT